MKIIRLIVGFAAMCAVFTPVQPISTSVARGLSVASAGVGGLAAGAIVSGGMLTKTLSRVIGMGVGYGLGEWFWHKFTPYGRLERAESLLGRLQIDSFCSSEAVATYESFTQLVVRSFFGSPWPLVLAHRHLCDLREQLGVAEDLLCAAQSESGDLYHVSMQVRDRRSCVCYLRAVIDQGIAYILLHATDQYQQQLKLYQRDQMLKQKERELAQRDHQRFDKMTERFDKERRHREIIATQKRGQ